MAPDLWITAAHFIAQCPLKTKFMLPHPEPKVEAGVQSRCQIDCWCDTSRVFDIQKSNHKSNLETFINLFFFLFFFINFTWHPWFTMCVENAGDFISTEHFQYALNDWLWRHMTVPGVDSSNTTRFAMYFLYYFYVSLAAATVVTVHVPLTTRA